jgi:hypothetical protein
VTRVNWKLVLARLVIVLILTQDRCTVCIKHTIGLKIILAALDGTSRRRGSCGITIPSIWRQCYCLCKIGWFAPNILSAQKSFWMHPMVLLGERLKWKLVSVRLEIVANLDARYVHGLH